MKDKPSEQKRIEIAACPCCGSEANAYRIGGWGQVRCSNLRDCNLKLEIDGGVDAAIKAWNRRKN